MKLERKVDSLELFEDKVGVYFLYKDDDIVYIGQSINIGNRIRSHKRGKGGYKKFTHYSYLPLKTEDLNNTEAILIYNFLPIHNKVMHKNDFVTNKQFLEKKRIINER